MAGVMRGWFMLAPRQINECGAGFDATRCISPKYNMAFISWGIEASVSYRILILIVMTMKLVENAMITRLMAMIIGLVTHLYWLV